LFGEAVGTRGIDLAIDRSDPADGTGVENVLHSGLEQPAEGHHAEEENDRKDRKGKNKEGLTQPRR
jgi:hypothetical protein